MDNDFDTLVEDSGSSVIAPPKLPGAGARFPAKPTLKSDPGILLRRAEEEMDQAKTGEADLLKRRQEALSKREEEIEKSGAEYEAAGKDYLATPMPGKTEMPNPDLGQFIDKKNYEQFSYGLLAMGLIGAVASRGNFLGAASAFGAALKGYKEGNEAIFKEKKEEYKRKLDAAMQQHKEAIDEYRRILDNKSMSLNMKAAMMKVEASKHHQEDLRFDAEQKNFDKMNARVDNLLKSYVAQTQKNDGMNITLAKISDQFGNATELTDEGMKVLDEMQTAGMPLVRTRRGQIDYEYYNRKAKTEEGGAGSGAIGDARMKYKTKQSTLKDFTSGPQSKNIIAINQALSHMGTLDELGKAMENKDIKLQNVILNKLATETGDPRVNNFDLATQAVGDELMRTFRQVGASEKEAQAFQEKFMSAGSPKQIRGALETGAHLLHGRIKAVNSSWKRGFLTDEDYPNLLDEEPRRVLEGFGIKPGLGSSEGTTQAPLAGQAKAGDPLPAGWSVKEH